MTVRVVQSNCATTAAYCIAAPMIKISLCVFFRRIFSPSLQNKIITWFAIVLTAVSYTAFFIAWIWCSAPHVGEGGWASPSFTTRVVKQTPIISVGMGALSTLTDFYTIVIPLVAIWGLNMSMARKISVSALFATGLLACGFSAAGLALRVINYRATIVHTTPNALVTASAYALA
ncbi:hypothetical protein VM1G_11354 [Cytospora mali]|uniref:Rhodopsin domain-containing protein n=1 Tax=Cytospora mali TaxID=578113 RepID=A0A194VKJ6_CYTMA|nr:hypothetical protein VM1G_11354 [Valsa mali]